LNNCLPRLSADQRIGDIACRAPDATGIHAALWCRAPSDRSLQAASPRYRGSMDLSAVLLPGAQNLISEMLKETWSAARSLVARVWARGDDEQTRTMEKELDEVRTEALELRARQGLSGESAESQIVAYCAGYLRHLVLDRPDVLATLQNLPNAALAGRDSVSVSNGAAQIINGPTGTALSIHQHTGDINLTNHG